MPRIRRRRAAFIVLGGLAAASAMPRSGAPPTAASGGADRPNILVVLTDDQDLLLGSLQAMPRLDELVARQGVTFGQATVPLSACCPARATLLRGQYAHNHGVHSNQPPAGGFARFRTLGRERRTLATALQEAGYRTALFGKYLNGYPEGVSPRHVPPGWDEWASPVAGDPYGEFGYTLNDDARLVEHGHAPEDYLTDVLAARSRRFVAEWAGRQPFFLLVAPYAPHKPFVPAPRHAALFADARVPRSASFDEADVTDKPRRARKLPRLTPRAVRELDAIYRDRLRALAAVDELVGALLADLEALGVLDSTYVIFTSDNGYHLGQHRLPAGKFTAYEEDVRVPLLVRGPGVERGAERDHLISQVDLAPTIAELAQARPAVEADGRSFAPLLRPDAPPSSSWRQLTLLEQFGFRSAAPAAWSALEPAETWLGAAVQAVPSMRGLRAPEFKYVEFAAGGYEFYDLATDPLELRNRAAELTRGQRAALTRLVARLQTCRGQECWQIESGELPSQAAR